MRLPIKRPNPAQILSMTDLSGGLNMRDGINEVLDNQLTNCTNMWWSDGVLKTRAALCQKKGKIVLGEVAGATTPKINKHDCYNIISSIKGQLCSVPYNEKINFFWNYGESMVKIAAINEKPNSYFVCQYSSNLYCFTSSRNIYRFDTSSGATDKWEKVADSELYIPKVMMQCRKNKSANISSSQIQGVMLEGYNLLNDYYEMSYNSYNPEIVSEEDQKHKMQYHLLKSVAGYKNKGVKVTAKFMLNGTEYIHAVNITEGATVWEEKVSPGDNLKMEVRKNRITFYDTEGKIATISDNSEAKATITTDGEDDIVIIAPYIWSNTRKQKIFNMTRCEWFGGSAGLMGGTRLFLCGNSKNNNSDLVVWSGLNNPLYFPENSYFYVGNETGAVTGFGKQSDKLIIFKENEHWFTQYQQNANITVEDLVNQNVIDYASSSVYFPLTQINSNIGCPYPDTIQLCRNRLVWLGNDLNVYTLVNESQYNERNTFVASEMVNRKIKEIAQDNISATACDWNGYYCLLLGNKMLLMDYNCYGYNHISGYSKTEDANMLIPWYYWEIPNGQKLMIVGGTLSVIDLADENGKYYIKNYCFDEQKSVDVVFDSDDIEKKIPVFSSFTTKIFDFGVPYIRKNVEQINLQVAKNGGEPINVFFVTENGTEQTEIICKEPECENYKAEYIESCAVFPCIKQVIRFGITIESNGLLAVDSIVLKYRTTGGAR